MKNIRNSHLSKSKNKSFVGGCCLSLLLAASLPQESPAVLSLYAPYDNNFDLTVATFPQPTITNGSVTEFASTQNTGSCPGFDFKPTS